MQIIRTVRDLRFAVREYRKFMPVGRIGLVPTMGYLHQGHASLMREAKRSNDFLAAWIFVNPLQFNNSYDFDTYPRNLDRDLEICEKEGVDLVFAPDAKEIYPDGKPEIILSMPSLTKNLCGPGRPGHFDGVMLVVARFFNLFQPDRAYFGKKDYQQFRILQRLVQDLAFPIEVIGCNTVREEDGLAMSSRNARLDAAAREQATLIYRALKLGEKTLREGEYDPARLAEIMKDVIESGPLNKVEYIQIVDPESLELIERFETAKKSQDNALLAEVGSSRSVLFATAVECGGVRLIDNLEVTLP